MQTIDQPRATALRQTWDNTAFFSGTGDRKITQTIDILKADIAEIGTACESFTPLVAAAETVDPANSDSLIEQIRSIHLKRRAVSKQLGNVSTYISTALSTDTQDNDAKTWMPILQKLSADLQELMTPFNVFLTRTREAFIDKLVQDPELAEMDFLIRHARKHKDQLLSVEEEQLVTALATNGLHTWGNLYTELAGTLKCEINGESMGLAKAANLLSHPDASIRQAAWEGIRDAWSDYQAPVAAGLSAINGWRLEETKKRSRQKRTSLSRQKLSPKPHF